MEGAGEKDRTGSSLCIWFSYGGRHSKDDIMDVTKNRIR